MRAVCFLLLLCACTSAPPKGLNESPFPLHSFLSEEMQGLRESGAKAEKTVIYNGTPETRNAVIPDWSQELKPGSVLRDDSLYWFQKFRIVSKGDDDMYLQSVADEYPVKEIRISTAPDTVIRIFSFSASPFYTIARLTSYVSGKYILTTGLAEMSGTERKNYSIITKIRYD